DRNLMAFYSAFVDTAINQAERQVEINRLEKQIRIGVMEWESIAAQADGQKRQSQAINLYGAWAAKNIDEDQLRARTEDLVLRVERNLMPFARAKYPEAISGSSQVPALSSKTNLDLVTVSLDWNTDWGSIAQRASDAIDPFVENLKQAKLYDPSQLNNSPLT